MTRAAPLIVSTDLFTYQFGGIHSDHQFLIGGDQQNLYLGVGSGNNRLLTPNIVGVFIHLYTHELQIRSNIHPG